MTLTYGYGYYRPADGPTLAYDWPVATWPEHRFACRVAFLGLLLPTPPASHFTVVIAPGPGPFRAAFHSLGLELLLPKSVHFFEVAICKRNQNQTAKCMNRKKEKKANKETFGCRRTFKLYFGRTGQIACTSRNRLMPIPHRWAMNDHAPLRTCMKKYWSPRLVNFVAWVQSAKFLVAIFRIRILTEAGA